LLLFFKGISGEQSGVKLEISADLFQLYYIELDKTRCVCETTQMPPKVANSNDSHAYVTAFKKEVKC
jgi:hypothetical protein